MSHKRKLTDYISSDVVDVVSVERKKFIDVLDLGGGLKAVYLTEPRLQFGGEYISSTYPLDFRHLQRFYTSDKALRATVMYYRSRESAVKSFYDTFAKLAKQHEDKTNFFLTFQSLPKSCDDAYGCIVNDIESLEPMPDAGENILSGVVKRRSEDEFYMVKALSLITGVPTHLLELKKIRKAVDSSSTLYMLNNYVQIYAKAGGIPWTASQGDSYLLDKTLVVGLSVAKHREGYYLGTAFSIALFGKDLMSFVTAREFPKSDVNVDDLWTRGLYIPKHTASELINDVIGRFKNTSIKRVVILQTPIIHEEEIKGLQESELSKVKYWFLTHVKSSGFAKRVYDFSTIDHGPYRGVCIVDMDSVKEFRRSNTVRGVLVASGRVRIAKLKRKDGRVVEEGEEERALYKGTPAPLELEVMASEPNFDPMYVLAYVARLVLLLGKLDWEAFTSWPKTPFVIKYARRLARCIAVLEKGRKHDTAEKLLELLKAKKTPLRLIM